MGEIIAQNMLSRFELLINRYCCIYLVVNIIYMNDAWSSKFQTFPVEEAAVKDLECIALQQLKEAILFG